MQLFFITYDPEKPDQEPTELVDALRQAGATQVLQSGWVLRGNTSVIKLSEDLQRLVTKHARLLVVQLDSWASRNTLADINAA